MECQALIKQKENSPVVLLFENPHAEEIELTERESTRSRTKTGCPRGREQAEHTTQARTHTHTITTTTTTRARVKWGSDACLYGP